MARDNVKRRLRPWQLSHEDMRPSIVSQLLWLLFALPRLLLGVVQGLLHREFGVRPVTFSPSTTSWCDIASTARLFLSTRLFHGAEIKDFEQSFARYIDVNQATSFARGRVALYAILRAMEVGPGDEVILPAYTCAAVPEAVLKTGATIVFADVNADTFNLTAETVKVRITSYTRVVLAQHTFGNPVELEPLLKLANQYGIKVIEDCATALGASYRGRKLGGWGDAALFSFDQSKLLSTEEGGMAVSKDPAIAQSLAEFQHDCEFPHYREIRGKLARSIARKLFLSPSTNWWGSRAYALCDEWFAFSEHFHIAREKTTHDSYNVRLPNAMAVLGLQQLQKIDRTLEARQATAAQYERYQTNWLIKPAVTTEHGERVYPYYSALCSQRQALLDQGSKAGIYLGKFFAAVVHPPGTPAEEMGYKPGSCPVAENVANTIVQLPTHPFLRRSDVGRTISLLNRFSNSRR